MPINFFELPHIIIAIKDSFIETFANLSIKEVVSASSYYLL